VRAARALSIKETQLPTVTPQGRSGNRRAGGPPWAKAQPRKGSFNTVQHTTRQTYTPKSRCH